MRALLLVIVVVLVWIPIEMAENFFALFIGVVLLGLLPSVLVWRAPLAWRGWRRELVGRLLRSCHGVALRQFE